MEDLDLGSEEKPKARGGGVFIALIVGVALGVAGTILLPRYLGDSLPGVLRGSQETVTGPVLGKQTEQDRLLLTVRADQGAVLATFRARVAEIDLLVAVGDTVTLGVSRYEPFVENPEFLGIRKAIEEPGTPPERASPESADSVSATEAGPTDGMDAAGGEPDAPADTLN